MYSSRVWDHAQNPRNRRVLPEANAQGESRYPKCGDHLILQLHTDEDRILRATFLARACGPVVAAASAGTELLTGITFDHAATLDSFQLDQALGGLPGPKRHALWMFFDCLHQALPQLKNLNSNSKETI